MTFVIDVDEQSFEQAVLARSEQVAVLVDFWAAWCAPCRALGPILEKLARELAGAFVLAKVDTERSPELARRFGVRGIPDVKLFVRGQVAGGFVGAQPESAVRRFLEQHLPNELDERVREAESMWAEGKVEDARAALERAVEEKSNHAGARLLLARLASARGDQAELEKHVAAMLPGPEAEQGAALLELSELARVARARGSLSDLESALRAHPEDPELAYARGAHLATLGRHREALEQLLSALSLRGAPREQVRRAMVALFTVLGPAHPLTQEYRRRLQVVL